jgi:KipI family sensor histidine kinase inhibitor
VRIRPVGATAALIDVPAGSSARWRQALVDLVAAGGLPAPDEIVPGWSTVLVDGSPAAALQHLIDGLTLPADAATTSTDLVEIPVVYDGVDLSEVARSWNTDSATVVKRHLAADFEVAFCGFAPGFAYLVGLDDTVPRRSTPRTRVPAGSVALAGRFCGIYPAASPGGWQIIGRTSVPLFDVAGVPPALLPPGTRVRFLSVDDQAALAPPSQPPRAAGPTGLTVVRAGVLSTVQDGGRFGSAHLGVPRAGALDAPAARLGNRLVGNRADAGVIETTQDGVAFRVERSATVAVTGAVAPVHIDGRAADWGNSISVRAGSLVEVGTAILGLRSYVAVSGGIDVPSVLGSRSTDTLSHLGPPACTDGMVLDIGAAAGPITSVPFTVPRPVGEVTLRLRVGPDDEWFTRESVDLLTSSTYTLSSDSNRIGARLHGPAIAWRSDDEMDSAGLVVGAVQVPPDGQPVVLLADHPTTGGYPVIGVVDAADLAALAQARPGTPIRLRRIGA